ncbi:MAG: helix-turn-helix transcriptional regulator [Labilithrix sp.]|nr:helix-turn-helix transcriptional regulator [Labilithrix sp.]
MTKTPDLVRVLEAAYAMDRAEGPWLRGIVDALRPALEDGLGMAAYVYDASRRPFVVREPILDCPLDAQGLGQLFAQSDESYVRGAWLAHAAATASETPGYADHPGVRDVFWPLGIRDVFVVNALDPVGVGCLVGAPLPRLRKLRDDERDLWDRVASHLRSALRLRLRLEALEGRRAEFPETSPSLADGTSGAVEAVLRRDGALEHAEDVAVGAREALREAVLGMDRARRTLRSRPRRVLTAWRALVRGRWTVVDDFEGEGSRYLVARANGPAARGPTLLSTRERQVLEQLVLGHTDKLVAYELGLSHSTVRVLITRARAKLGAKTRAELIEKFRAATTRR